jgi:hypothetical protein
MNNDLNIGRILRAVDRRIVALILIGLVATFALQTFMINPSEKRITVEAQGSAKLEEETIALEGRVQEILSNGTQSIDDVTARVSALERVIPTAIDDLALTAELFQLAAADITIETISESELTPPAPKTGLSYMLYEVTGSGSIGSLGQFLEVISLTGTHIITVDELKVSAAAQRNGDSQRQQQNTAGGVNSSPSVDFELRLRVWFDPTERLLNKPRTPATDDDATDNTESPAAGDGATNPTGDGTGRANPATGAQTTPADGQGQNAGAGDNGLVPGQQVLPGQSTNG